MTLYIQPYPFNLYQNRPLRRIARRWMADASELVREGYLAVNVREEDEAFVLSALVPGLKAEDLNIQVLEDVVRIEGEYKTGEGDYLVHELPAGSFGRSLRIPTAIKADQIEAKITDGVLTLRLPKAESVKPKKIKVTTK
jgi:HSP20 family protein